MIEPIVALVMVTVILYAIKKIVYFIPPNSEFVEWCKTAPECDSSLIYFSGYEKSDGQHIDERVNKLCAEIAKGHIANISIDAPFPPEDYVINGVVKTNTKDPHVRNLEIRDFVGRTFTINSLNIGKLIIRTSIETKFVLNNCEIAELEFSTMGSVAKNEIELNNTKTGVLKLHGDTIKGFKVCGGAVLNIDCPPPQSTNPFCGSVSFDRNVFFPKDTKSYLLKGPQPYRNMRHHLRSLENETNAAVFHGLELTIERETDSFLNKVLSHCYGLFSGYGSSVVKPLAWLLMAFLLSFGTIYYKDGAIINGYSNKKSIDLSGWQSALGNTGHAGRMLRAGVFSGQYVLYPLSLVTGKSLLIPRTTNLLYMTIALSFFSTIFLFLLILAIRRRFKMS